MFSLLRDDEKGCTVGFVGIGKSNLALMRLVPRDCGVVLRSDKKADLSSLPCGLKIKAIYEGDVALKDIREDVLVLSPSVRRDRPEINEAVSRGVRVTSDYEVFFEGRKAPVLAVTGSSGKSTTATMAHLMLGGACCGSALIGNIGTPMCEAPENARVYVAELSSFMLEHGHAIVDRSVITNVTPNHLDYHGSFESYKRAKLSLMTLSHQAIVNADDPILREAAGNRRLFGAVSTEMPLKELIKVCRADVYMTYENSYLLRNGEKLLHASALFRSDRYLIANALCAVALTDGYALKEQMLAAIGGFSGLSHRCETVATVGGVRYIDSSIDTTPERCAVTLTSYGKPVILLMGGRGKGLSYREIRDTLARFCKQIILFGEEREKIYKEISDICEVDTCESFSDAVALARRTAIPGDTVMLSPACTSYDEFRSFEERGEAFRRLINQ